TNFLVTGRDGTNDPVTAKVTASAAPLTSAYTSLPDAPPQQSLETNLDEIVKVFFVDQRYLSILVNQTTGSNTQPPPTGADLQPGISKLSDTSNTNTFYRQLIFHAVETSQAPSLDSTSEPN